MAEVATLTLANICLDVQIGICIFLHPFDILALRKTCKALQHTTRQRVVWVSALHQVCLDNTLFLPSFPISDMSDLELEKAAMAPRRWIGLCAAFEKQHLNDPGARLCQRATRIINDSLATAEINYAGSDLFIVPGGRYLVISSSNGISVWDLGYTSSADCKPIASVGLKVLGIGEDNTCVVQATPDGMGLIIVSCNSYENCSVYEIYPQNESPHLTQIGHLDCDPSIDPPAYLLPGTVTWFGYCENGIVFKVWGYRLNYSIIFSVYVDLDKFKFILEVIATKTAIIVLCEEAILIYAIPPLSPQPPDFFDHYPTRIPPLFTIPFPDAIVLHSKLIEWNRISSWYFGSSQPLYFDMLCQDSKLHRFKLIVEPDLSDASLHVINTSELTPHNFDDVSFQSYSICEDTLVSRLLDEQYQCGVYTGLTSARFANVISHGGPAAKMLLPDIGHDYRFSSCPASGRFVLLDRSNSVSVLDFF